MDEFILWLRVLLSLGAVLAVLWLLQRRLHRRGGTSGAALPLNVVARQGVGQKSAVVIVDTGGRRFLLGVTEQSINVLHSEEVPEEEQAPAPDGFAPSLEYASRRGSRTALEGSILSPRTWQQGADALRKGFRN